MAVYAHYHEEPLLDTVGHDHEGELWLWLPG